MGTISGDLRIRTETSADRDAIRALTSRAFATMPFSSGTEAAIIDRLRDQGLLTLSLVAILDERLAGHAAFSSAAGAAGSEVWAALGPISVEPGLQRRGIGKRLIAEGLSRLVQQGMKGCILVGDPAYYQQSGFTLAPRYCPASAPPAFFMMRKFGAADPPGILDFQPTFFEGIECSAVKPV